MTEFVEEPETEVTQSVLLPEVLEEVRKQFPDKQVYVTTVPGGETLASQKADQVIGFDDNADWVFDPKEQERLHLNPTVPTDVIYLSTAVDSGTFTKSGRYPLGNSLDKYAGQDSGTSF